MMVRKLSRCGAIALAMVAGVPAQTDADRELCRLLTLVSGEPSEAKQALSELGQIGPRAGLATEVLLAKLEDAQEELREQILVALGLVGARTPRLVHALWRESATSASARVSVEAVLERPVAGEERVGELLMLWEGLHPSLQTMFERDARIVPGLCRWLEADGAWEKDRRSTQLALSMLPELGAAAAPAMPVLLRRLQELNRLPAVRGDLAAVPDTNFLQYVTRLAPYAPEHHAAVRRALDALQESDWLPTRLILAIAPLRDLTIATPMEKLIAALSDQDVGVRLLAVDLLARRGRGARPAVAALAATILDMPPEIRPMTKAAIDWVSLLQRVPEAMARIDPDHPIAKGGFWVGVKCWSIPERAAIVRALGAVRAEEAWPMVLLVERLRDERSVSVVGAALRAIAERAEWPAEAQFEVERYRTHPLPEIASLAEKALAGR